MGATNTKQTDTFELAKKKKPQMMSAPMLSVDSLKKYMNNRKGQPFVLFVISPECIHCKKTCSGNFRIDI